MKLHELTIIDVAFNDGMLQSIGNATKIVLPLNVDASQLTIGQDQKQYDARVVVTTVGDRTTYRVFFPIAAQEGT